MSLFRLRRRRLRDFSCIPWFPPAFERRTRPLPVTLNRLAAALFVFIFGMTRLVFFAPAWPPREGAGGFWAIRMRKGGGLWSNRQGLSRRPPRSTARTRVTHSYACA